MAGERSSMKRGGGMSVAPGDVERGMAMVGDGMR